MQVYLREKDCPQVAGCLGSSQWIQGSKKGFVQIPSSRIKPLQGACLFTEEHINRFPHCTMSNISTEVRAAIFLTLLFRFFCL